MRRMLRSAYATLCQGGLDPLKIMHTIAGIPLAYFQLLKFHKISRRLGITTPIKFLPSLHDKRKEAGQASGIYFHQDLYIARKIFENEPLRHIDVGSRIDGLVAHIASFRSVDVIDIRPINSKVKNISFIQADMTGVLNIELENICDSLSSTFAIGHFGLGRYGDKLDPQGHVKGLANLEKMIRPGGLLYLSVPIGPQKVEFNSHRIFSLDWLIKVLQADYKLVEYSYVDDEGVLHENITLDSGMIESNCGCKYGAGIFILQKIK